MVGMNKISSSDFWTLKSFVWCVSMYENVMLWHWSILAFKLVIANTKTRTSMLGEHLILLIIVDSNFLIFQNQNTTLQT